MQLKTIKQINSLENKTVLVRVDFNVPIKNNKVLDNSRIKSSLPTIKYLIEKKAKINEFFKEKKKKNTCF